MSIIAALRRLIAFLRSGHINHGSSHIRFERNDRAEWPGHPDYAKGWRLTIKLGPGSGQRWIDLPGHSMNINDGWRCRKLYISGRTLTIATNQRHMSTRKTRKLWVTGLTKKCNLPYIPAWWS